MTPKEKAEELVNRFRIDVEMPSSCNYATPGKDAAKQCAIICVEEMKAENQSVLKMLHVHGDGRNRLPVQQRIAYLYDVKTEIEKL